MTDAKPDLLALAQSALTDLKRDQEYAAAFDVPIRCYIETAAALAEGVVVLMRERDVATGMIDRLVAAIQEMERERDALREQLTQADAVIDAYASEMFEEDRPFPSSPDSPTHIANACARHMARVRDAARKRAEDTGE